MIASLPMYDRPETRAAYGRLWARIRDTLRGQGLTAPDTLTPTDAPWDHWRAPDMVLSQTCGLPYRSNLHDRIEMIGTPDYALPGCPPGYYNSVLVMRRDDDRRAPEAWEDLRLAINGRDSQSGWGAAMNHATDLGTTFGQIIETGAHRASARAIAEGQADIASIDAQTWRMICRWGAVADALIEVQRTEPTPGLPLITAQRDMVPALKSAAETHLRALPDDDRRILDVGELVWVAPEHYHAVPTPKALQST